MLVRLDDREQPQIADYLGSWFSGGTAESWAEAIVVASPRKIRVLRKRLATEERFWRPYASRQTPSG